MATYYERNTTLDDIYRKLDFAKQSKHKSILTVSHVRVMLRLFPVLAEKYFYDDFERQLVISGTARGVTPKNSGARNAVAYLWNQADKHGLIDYTESGVVALKTACETVVEPITVDPNHGSADSHVQAFDRHVDGLPEVDLACMVCSRIIESESYSDCLCCGCIDAGYAIFWQEGTPTVLPPDILVVDPNHGLADNHVQAYELECMTRQRQIDIHKEYTRYSEACMVAGRLNMLQDATQAKWHVATVRSGVWRLTTDIKKVLAGVVSDQATEPTVLPSDITAAYAHLETAYTHFDTLLDDNINLSDAEWGIFDSCESWVSYRL